MEDEIEWRRRQGDKKLTEDDDFVPSYKPVKLDSQTVIDYLKGIDINSIWDNQWARVGSYGDNIFDAKTSEYVDISEIKKLTDKDETLIVVSDDKAKLIKAMGVRVYKISGINFAKQSDFQNVVDKL